MSHRNRRRSSHPPWLLLGLTLALLSGFPGSTPAAPAPAPAAQTEGTADGGGLDYFTTLPAGTFFDFGGEFALPAGFFDKESARFSGRVPFKGVPLESYQGRKTGKADTVLQRKGGPAAGTTYPRRSEAEIELVQLSLASARPISVQAGGKAQLWDVRLQLSKSRQSKGRMAIVQRNARGGTFDSEFVVYPTLTFKRRGDGAERELDIGRMQLTPDGTKRMTLSAKAVPWATKAPARAVNPTATFTPGVVNGSAVRINHHNHAIILTTILPGI